MLSNNTLAPDMLAVELRGVREAGQVIELAGQPVGLVKVIRSQEQWKLLQLQVLPPHQGRGIGTGVVLGVLKQARAANVPVVLTVLKGNPAKRFYERVGFLVVGEREHVYEMRVGANNVYGLPPNAKAFAKKVG
jgi:ribosomal protein S18 acetylase RimI-like enzyme